METLFAVRDCVMPADVDAVGPAVEDLTITAFVADSIVVDVL